MSWLHIFHFLGLTNLSETEVRRYETLRRAAQTQWSNSSGGGLIVATAGGRNTGPRSHRSDHISRIATFANWSIAAVAGVIALSFVELGLKDIPISVLSNVNPDHVQAVILVVYLFSRAYGASIDTKVQIAIYTQDPGGGRLRVGTIAVSVNFTAIALILLLVRKSELQFALALAAFTTIDFLAWLYLRYSLLPPIIFASQRDYEREGDHYGQLILKKVTSQVIGNWNWQRQLVLSVIALAMVALALHPQLRDSISGYLNTLVPSLPAGTIRTLLPDMLLLAFVLVSELWSFAFRLDPLPTVRFLDEIEANFKLVPKAA